MWVQVFDALLLIHLTANAPEKEADHDTSCQAPAIDMVNHDGLPVSWLQLGSCEEGTSR